MIERELRGTIAILRLAHKKASAMDLELLHALEAAFAAEQSSPARAVVLTGTGSIFSAGVDLFRVLEGGRAYLEQFLPALDSALKKLLAFEKPLVAAINGHAIAGGAVLAATADLRLVADSELKIGLTEIQVGVAFPTSALEAVRFSCAGRHLREILFRGLTYGPADAVARNLADELVPAAELQARALALAGELAEARPLAFASSKRALRADHLARIRAAAEAGLDPVWRTWQTQDALQAMAAFRDRTLRKKAGL